MSSDSRQSLTESCNFRIPTSSASTGAEKREDASLLSQAVRKLGGTANQDKLARILDDHIIDGEGRVLTQTRDIERFFELQRQYRRLDIVASPDPFLLLQVSKAPAKKEVALIVSQSEQDSEIIERITPHLKRRFTTIEKVSLPAGTPKERDMTLLMLKTRTSRWVLGSGLDRICISLVVSSGTPFCLLNPQCGRYSQYLQHLDLQSLIIEAQNYEQFKPLFQQTFTHSLQNMPKLTSALENERKGAAVTQKCLHYLEKLGPVLPLTSEGHANINFHCHPRTYQSNRWLQTLAEQLSNYGSCSGYYIELSTYNSLVQNSRIHLQPWIGVLEVVTEDRIATLISSSEWKNSLTWCCGLLVPCSKSSFKRVKASLHGVRMSRICLPLVETEICFDLASFLSRPRLTFYRQTTLTLSLPLPAPDLQSDSESSDSYDSSENPNSTAEDQSSEDDVDSVLFSSEDEGEGQYGSHPEPIDQEYQNDEGDRKSLKQLLSESTFDLEDPEEEIESKIKTTNTESPAQKGENSTAILTSSPDVKPSESRVPQTPSHLPPPPPSKSESAPILQGPYWYYQSEPRNGARDLQLLETCIPVIESEELGLLSLCLSVGVAPLVYNSQLALEVLGPEYPLYIETLDPEILAYICSPSRLERGLRYISQLSSKSASGIPKFIRGLDRMK